MQVRAVTITAILLLALGCDPGDAQVEESSTTQAAAPSPSICRVESAGNALPEAIRESSGIARSGIDDNLFWTHNDRGNEPVLYGIDAAGALVRTLDIAAPMTDWEDIESAQCSDGHCLYIADIGDNGGGREHITVYRIREPDGTGTAAAAEAFHGRYPQGPRDAEALFLLPTGDAHVVTKGRSGPVELYRFPLTQPDAAAPLEFVRQLAAEPSAEERVTAATSTPDGRWVAVRSSHTLHFYPAAALVSGAVVEPLRVDLRPLREAQGEAVAVADDGTVMLTSEAESRGSIPTWSRLRCTLPD